MQVFKLTFLVLLAQETISYGFCVNPSNNACPSWQQYDQRALNSACRYNPDGDLTLVEIVQRYNYPVEQHTVLTRDNYQLIQFRINKNNGPSLLIVHGIYQNAIVWTLDGPNSLAFVLADAGYDVWLANVRGTSYSSNTVYGEDSKEYWDFTPNEMGTIDIPAILEHIYNINGNHQIQVLAFSMGTTNMLIYSSMLPGHATTYVARQTLMAPVATLNNLKTPIQFTPPFWNLFGTGLESSNQYYILKPTPASKQAAVLAFTPTTSNVLAFWKLMGAVLGYSCQLNAETFYVTIKNGGNAISVSVLSFYENIMKRGIFVAYDYGSDAVNNQHYGTSTPPIYPLCQIKIPTSLVYGENDQLATPENVATLANNLSPSIGACVIRVPLTAFQHTDFVNAKDAKDILYQPLINDILPGTCKNASTFCCAENYFANM